MEFNDLLQSNIAGKKEQNKCENSAPKKKGIRVSGHELDEIRIIYRRCKNCGKFVVCPDPEWIALRGESGRG